MSTIPASAIVNILPGVVGVGGNQLVLNGLMLVHNFRVPTGQVMSFASEAAVGSYFGQSSPEYAKSENYFGGYYLCTQLPGSFLLYRATDSDVAAWLRSAQPASLAAIQAVTGNLSIVMDGYTHTISSVNLSADNSFSAAAATLQSAFSVSSAASVTGAIAAETFSVTGSINGNVLTVTAVASGTVYPGSAITGTGVTAGTTVGTQLSGAAGGVGTYAVSTAQSVPSGTTISGTYGLFTVSAVSSGTLAVGQVLTGTNVTAGTQITALISGTGLTGTYAVNDTETVSSETITANPPPIAVTFDSTSNAFYFTSGMVGNTSSAAYATGSAAAGLGLTQQTGAQLSQGVSAETPGAIMNSVIAITQNWASFFTLFDPDDGAANGPTQKLLYSQWNSAQNSRYCYVAWDSDITPTESATATGSLGYLIANTDLYQGTSCWYDPTNEGLAAFNCGIGACLNFNATNGRTTFAFRSQAGVVATVTNQQVAANLLANGYNFYGAYATANAQFVWNYNGSVSGPFLWLDSYFNQIWMNNMFQLALMTLLQQVPSIPYNVAGYTMIAQALASSIAQAINFGAIRTGIPLSSTEALTVNTQAGYAIDQILSTQGWYLQIQPAPASVRAARTTPTCYFWYTDGQSVQQITLNSLEIV